MLEERNDAPWFFWYVKQGEWYDRSHELGFLDGSLEAMAQEVGGVYARLMHEQSTPSVELTVYYLTTHHVTSEEEKVVAQWEDHERTHTGSEIDEWEKAHSGTPPWFYWFKSIHPSSYLVYIHWRDKSAFTEVHGIFCATYKDMVEVVKLHKGL